MLRSDGGCQTQESIEKLGIRYICGIREAYCKHDGRQGTADPKLNNRHPRRRIYIDQGLFLFPSLRGHGRSSSE